MHFCHQHVSGWGTETFFWDFIKTVKTTGTHFLDDCALLGYFAASMDILGHPINPILRVQESKRKPVAPLWGLCREECGWWKVLVVLCQPVGLMQVFEMERSVLVSAAWRETLRVRVRHRRILTRAKWEEGKGKNVQYLITKLIIQSKRMGGRKY
jgi:hypothetical protein